MSIRSIVTEPNLLFGRNSQLSQLVSLANSHYSLAITGLRRFGKTSLLICVVNTLKADQNSRVYPVYFDFKEKGSSIRGTENVYKYMISVLASQLCKDGHFDSNLTIKKSNLSPSIDWEDIYDELKNVSAVRTQGVLEELIKFFADLLGKTILFIIDEYEWLFRFSFDEPIGFMSLRNFASMGTAGSYPVFSFWVAGALSWDYLCTLTGSGELNVIDGPPIALGGISKKDFSELWRHAIASHKENRENVRVNEDFAYNASGGIPFYGKMIAAHIAQTGKQPQYGILKSYFEELLGSISIEEQQLLDEIAKLPRNFKPSKHAQNLVDKGLIEKKGSAFYVTIGFLEEYLKERQQSNGSYLIVPESHSITDKITDLISNINQTFHNKKGNYIFVPVNDEAALIRDLRTQCYTIESFKEFSNSLYKILFERTKDTSNGAAKAKLPAAFKKKNEFIDIVDIMRHSLGGAHLMGTFISRVDQMSKSDMLFKLTGSRNEPFLPEDFYNLQIAALRRFETELIKLNQIVRALL